MGVSRAGTVQTYLPRAVADALPIQGLAMEAQGAGLEGATLQYSTTRWRPAETLVTCQYAVAEYVLERLRRLAGEAARNGEDDLAGTCAVAIGAWTDAMQHAYTPQGGAADGIRPPGMG